MLVIRQLMTEVLLEVTTEEIRSAAIEAHQQAKGKLDLSTNSSHKNFGYFHFPFPFKAVIV